MNKNLRITNLDFIRGVALLGILVMNVISFGLPISAYYNHSSYGAENTLDWIVVIISSIFFDSKMMGLFLCFLVLEWCCSMIEQKKKLPGLYCCLSGEIFYCFVLALYI